MEDLDKYITYEKGTIPLILSVPHGGDQIYEEIPERSSGILGIDKNTILLTENLIDHIQSVYQDRINKKEKPSFIFCKVTRSKIDLNRPIEKAFNQTSILAKKVYQKYHEILKQYILHNIEIYNKSLLFDIHGFEVRSRPWGFRDVDIILGTNNLKSLFTASVKKKDWKNNIRGEIISKFLELDIPIAPGHQRRREYVLSGGYITKKYGASQLKNSESIQIEFSDRIRNYDGDLKSKVLKSLAEIIFTYFNQS
jgi:N-formylglutamate amidohydrolase